HVGLNVWAGHGAPPPPPEAVGLELFQIVVPAASERQIVIDRLESAGVELSSGADSATIRLHDPNGNQIEI
ncbi:MAG: glyoxalase, partial [Anaerolineales bacterium]